MACRERGEHVSTCDTIVPLFGELDCARIDFESSLNKVASVADAVYAFGPLVGRSTLRGELSRPRTWSLSANGRQRTY